MGRLRNSALRRAVKSTLTLCALCSTALAQTSTAQFEIPTGEATVALQLLAEQSGYALLYPHDAVVGRRVPAIRGRMSPIVVGHRFASASGLELVGNDRKAIKLRGYTTADGMWAASAFINNVENEAVRSAAFPSNRVMRLVPRTYGAGFNAKF